VGLLAKLPVANLAACFQRSSNYCLFSPGGKQSILPFVRPIVKQKTTQVVHLNFRMENSDVYGSNRPVRMGGL
jgi:hypothetical protein